MKAILKSYTFAATTFFYLIKDVSFLEQSSKTDSKQIEKFQYNVILSNEVNKFQVE